MNCTLKVNMILGDGQHYPRGSIVDRELLPRHLQIATYIEEGIVTINRIMPVDEIELKDELEELDETASPMRELTLAELEPQEEVEVEKPRIVRRPVKRKLSR